MQQVPLIVTLILGERGTLARMDVVDQLIKMYEESVDRAHAAVKAGDRSAYSGVRYPRLTVTVDTWQPIDRTEPFGYVEEAGVYSSVFSRPGLVAGYLREMLARLTKNYSCDVRADYSDIVIPPAYIDGLEGAELTGFPTPTLDDVDDGIIDGRWDAFHGEVKPLFHFTPQRFDIACKRIEHYTGIGCEGVQKFILFTNYAMHTKEFERWAREELTRPGTRYTGLNTPTGTHQFPRYDLVTEAGDGITMINIGVGPSNAKTITDSLAVLRPEVWVMIGHCAGLDGRMRIGDLILGNAYQRRDFILDDRISSDIPIPAVPEVQRALEKAVGDVYGEEKSQLMRTGTVLSTGDRNWEWHTPHTMWETLRGSTAVAVDMESCALAANGYRYRVPYGTLLSVSDLPLHAVPKLPAGAQAFYSSSKEAHVMCAVRAMEALAANVEKLRTRKLRKTIGEVPFR